MMMMNFSKHILRIIGIDRAIQNESIVRRLTLRLSITILVVSVFAVIAMNYIVSQAVMRDYEQKADDALIYLSGSLGRPLWNLNSAEAKSIAQAVFLDKAIGRLIVRSESGIVICSLEKGPVSTLITREGKITFKQWGVENIVGDVSVSIHPDIYGKNHQRQLIVSMVMIFIILVSVMTVVVRFFRTSLDWPLKKLSEIISQFASGRYSTAEIDLPYVEFQPFGRVLAEMGETIGEQIRKLREAEARYRIVADNTYDWEFWTDENDQYVYISPSCQRITGFPAEAFKENPALLDRLIHPDDLESYKNHLGETQSNHCRESIEFRIFDQAGQLRWIEHFCQPVFDEQGKWLGTRGNNREVTHRKETEQLQQLATSVLGILNEPTALTETINRILEKIRQEMTFDAVGLRLQSGDDFPYFASSGFPDDFLVAENSLVVPGRDGDLCRDENGNVCLECTCGLVLAGKTDPANPLFTPAGSCWTNNSLPLLELPADQDPRLHPRNLCIHKDFFSVALIPIRANQKIIGLLQLNDHKKDRLTRDMIAYFEDICGSIGLTLMKKQAEEALKSSEARFRRLTENARDVIYRMALPDGLYEYISPAATELFGYTPEEFYALPELRHKLIHPDWQTYFTTEWEKMLRGEMPPSYEYQIIHKSGETRWMNQRNILVHDEEGQIVAIEGIVTDITDSKRTEEKLRRFNAELERRVEERTAQLQASNKELEAFCYSVSHDLRAPLRHLDGYVALLVKRCRADLNEQGLHYLGSIAASARQMGALTDDLLQFSRTGRVEMQQITIDMNLALQEALAPVQETCAGRSIEWVIGELPAVRGDFPLVRQVWANLLRNAVKYTRTRERARIEVGSLEADGEIVFVVADNGVGFDMQYAGKLFGVFQRLHSQEEFEGTGIGLATVQRIINRHGGRVWAEAELERGARFYFTLPRRAGEGGTA